VLPPVVEAVSGIGGSGRAGKCCRSQCEWWRRG